MCRCLLIVLFSFWIAPFAWSASVEIVQAVETAVGLRLQDVAGSKDGVLIVTVVEDSNAQSKGIAAGSRLISVSGQLVSNIEEVLTSLKDAKIMGRTAVLLGIRDDRQFSLFGVKLSDLPATAAVGVEAPTCKPGCLEGKAIRVCKDEAITSCESREVHGKPSAFCGVEKYDAFQGCNRGGTLGVSAKSLTQDLASSLGISTLSGAVIESVAAGSPAEKGGLKQNDVIIAVGEHPIRDPIDLNITVRNTPPGEKLAFEILRNGIEMELLIAVGTL